MLPANKSRREILKRVEHDDASLVFGILDTDAQVGAAYDRLCELDYQDDYESAFRSGQVETSIPAPSSRHYESRSVAAKCLDGSWVGWTYWYGGGKHAEPDAIDWLEDAYDLDCVEEEKLVVIQTFTKK